MADAVNGSLEVINGVTQTISPLLSRIVLAVLILLVGLIVGKLLGNLMRRILNEVQLDKHVRSGTGFRISLEKFIGNLTSYFIYFITIVLTLNSLGLTAAMLIIITAIILFVLAVSFLLAVKDFFPNIMAGIRIKMKHLFSEGDEIQIKEVRGKITAINLLETRLLTSFKEEVIIPNSLFNKRQVVVRKKASAAVKKK